MRVRTAAARRGSRSSVRDAAHLESQAGTAATTFGVRRQKYWVNMFHWIGLRENLNRKPWFLPLNMEVSCKISRKPIQWMFDHHA